MWAIVGGRAIALANKILGARAAASLWATRRKGPGGPSFLRVSFAFSLVMSNKTKDEDNVLGKKVRLAENSTRNTNVH